MATYSVNNIKIDNGLFFTPGPTAGYVLSINSNGSTTWITPQSGSSGVSGSSGTSGANGQNGQSSSLFLYKAKTNSYTNNPGNSYILWNNATQTGATAIHINHLTQDNIDIDIFLALIRQGSNLIIQHQSNSSQYQTWDVNGTPTLVSGADNYWIIPVSLINSTISFSNNADIFVAISADSGTSGSSGSSGTSGVNGSSGTSGVNGSSGTSGVNGSSGANGATGSSGTSGKNGTSGTSSSATALATLTSLTTTSLIKATASTAYMMGLGLTGSFGNAFTFTPSSVGVINVLIKASTNSSVATEINYELRYGTGTAPSSATVASGTSIDNLRLRNSTINQKDNSLTLSAIVSGLTTGITYWFDISSTSSSTCDNNLYDIRLNVFELR